MSLQPEKPPKIGTEITVRISVTFQEAPDVHTLLAMTPVRERGKLVRLALERYIAETGHPAGDVDQQIHMIATWLRSRTSRAETTASTASQHDVYRTTDAARIMEFRDTSEPLQVRVATVPAEEFDRSDSAPGEIDASSSSIKRWLQA